MPNINERMIQRIDADPNLTPEQKRELKVRWGWQDTKGSISAEKKPSWYNAGDRLAYEVEKRTNTTGPVSAALRMIGGFGDLDKGPSKATSVLGTFATPPLKDAAQRLEHLVPESVKRLATERTKNRMARILSEHASELPLQARVEAIDVAGSDPIANLLIQDDINVMDSVLMSSKGKYDAIFGSYNHPKDAAARMEMFAQTARTGSPKQAMDLIRRLAREERQHIFGHPHAITINQRRARGGRDIANTMSHEGTHASQDRMGVLRDPRMRPLEDYASQPVEWEANYAGNYQQDPALSHLLGVLQQGQQSMAYRGYVADQDVLRRVLGAINRDLISRGKGNMLLDIHQSTSGPIVKANAPANFDDRVLRELVKGLLGLK